MQKKTSIIIMIIIIIVSAMITMVYQMNLNKTVKEDRNGNDKTNKKETTIKEENKEEDIMDGITVNYHSSIRIEKEGKIIYFDPFKIADVKNDADYVFITHSHYDHYDEASIKKVMNDNTKFIITNDLETKVKNLGVKQELITVVYPNEKGKVDDINFDTIAAYNINKSYHKKSNNWVGYNVQINDFKYYVVGDSDVTDEFKAVRCDVIFIPVGGTYTMTDKEAIDAINEMKPKYAVPVHYNEVGSNANANTFISNLNSDIKGILLN